MTQLEPFYENVRAHYDLSNEFYQLFLDPNMNYSCALFERDDMTLEEAQQAKIDMTLRKADVHPGHRVLDVGFGWGHPLRSAAERFGADALGLTLSQAQYDYVERKLAENPPSRGKVEIRIQGWEQFQEPVDRIFSLEVFEHFRKERYAPFFARCHEILPDDGRLVLQTNLMHDERKLEKRGISVAHEDVLFGKFIRDVIFPGSTLCDPDLVLEHAHRAGFNVTEVESLAPHYVPTLNMWAAKLEAHRDRAIEVTSQETYDNYLHYLTGCAQRFESGHIDVMQFTCCKQ